MRRNRGRQAFIGTLIVSGLAGSFALGRATRTADPPALAARPAVEAQPPDQARPTGARGRPPVFTVASGEPSAAAGCEPTDRQATAASLVEGLFARLPGRMEGWSDSPETSANAARSYLAGMSEAVKQSSPAVRAAFAREFSERLCRGSLRDDQLITMAYLGMEMPEIAAPEALDCVFSRRGGQEDAVLWYMLDTWRTGGGAKTPAIAQIERNARDPRTQRRFLTPEEQMATRAGGRPSSAK